MTDEVKDRTTVQGIACHIRQYLEHADVESSVEALLNLISNLQIFSKNLSQV